MLLWTFVKNILWDGEKMDGKEMKFCFGDIVIVDEKMIGVIVKSRISNRDNSFKYEVYVRSHNTTLEYYESEIEKYMVGISI